MKSISAEDKRGIMRYGRNIGMGIFLVAILILISSSFYVTPLSVSDTDPSTYVIVPILMLPLFALFSIKTNPNPNVDKKDLVVGSLMFAVFILLTVFLRFYFSFFFISFRVDMLILPLAIASLATLIFGISNVPKFRGIMLYSVLASPTILAPVIKAYSAFTAFNTLMVYNLMKPFISNAKYIAPITINANGYYIGIGQACVSIGIFIALTLFLVPIAYFYDGKNKRKVVWVASGVALLFVLNIARMLSVSYTWLTYGPSNTILFIHVFVGVLLFYAAIVIMMLTARKYGLAVKEVNKQRKKFKSNHWAVLIALVFSFIYLYVTLNYATALKVSPLALTNQVKFDFTNKGIADRITGPINSHNFTSFAMTSQNGTYTFFSLSNKTINMSNPIEMIITVPDMRITESIKKDNTLEGVLEFLNNNGAKEEVLDVISNSTEFFVYDTSVPFVLPNMSSTVFSAYVIIPGSVLQNIKCAPNYNRLYTFLLNVFNPANYNQKMRQSMLNTLCVSEKLVWSDEV